MPEMIQIKAWSIERATIEIDAEHYETVKRAYMLDHELDHELSDMGGDTFLIEASGKVLAPYDSPVERSPEWVMEMITPLLDQLPHHLLDIYVMGREQA